MSLSESLVFEIASTQAQLDALETQRKMLKKKLKNLNLFLAEFSEAKKEVEKQEANHE